MSINKIEYFILFIFFILLSVPKITITMTSINCSIIVNDYESDHYDMLTNSETESSDHYDVLTDTDDYDILTYSETESDDWF